jgi:hypothetical protein
VHIAAGAAFGHVHGQLYADPVLTELQVGVARLQDGPQVLDVDVEAETAHRPLLEQDLRLHVVLGMGTEVRQVEPHLGEEARDHLRDEALADDVGHSHQHVAGGRLREVEELLLHQKGAELVAEQVPLLHESRQLGGAGRA